MKNNIKYLWLIFLFPLMVTAQQIKKCATNKVMSDYFSRHPEAKAKWMAREAELEKEDAKAFKNGYKNSGYEKVNNGQQIASATTYTIPIVFHILYQDAVDSISDAQVLDQVRILNRDYRKLNPDTSVTIVQFKAIATDVGIEFGLATIDPNGNCTNGIIRHNDPHTDWYSGNFDWYKYTWDPAKYLNIYVVKNIDGNSGIGGYTYLPGSFGISDPADVVVIVNFCLGSIGTGFPELSRCVTHEVGHWLNLQHPWGSTNSPGVACGNDGVADTPITEGSSNCDTTLSQCNFPIIENVQNYMDYSFCSTMFTAGQVARMRNTIINNTGNIGRSNVVTALNLSNTGAGLLMPQLCANFKSSKRVICAGDSIQFSDNSSLGLPVTTWSWSFPGANPSVSNDSMPVVHYNAGGVFAVSYTITNSFTNASAVKSSYITVFSAANSQITPFAEGFESVTIPGSLWSVDKSEVNGNTWAVSSNAFSSGAKSVFINNINNLTANISTLQSSWFDISTVSVPVLSFKKAYQQTNVSYQDNLEVFASTDCGNTWISVWSQAGNVLATVPNISSSSFVPTPAQFSTEVINLSNISTNGLMLFKWVFSADSIYQGNNIYLDEINLFDANTTGIKTNEDGLNFSIYPNPSSGKVNIAFNLNRTETVSVCVVDLIGRTVETITSQVIVGENKVVLGDKEKYPAGIYFVTMNVGEKRVSKKIVIQ